MIKIKRAKNGQYFFTIQARNGQVIVTSETYKSKAGVWNGIKAICNIISIFSFDNMIAFGQIKDETAKPVKKK